MLLSMLHVCQSQRMRQIGFNTLIENKALEQNQLIPASLFSVLPISDKDI